MSEKKHRNAQVLRPKFWLKKWRINSKKGPTVWGEMSCESTRVSKKGRGNRRGTGSRLKVMASPSGSRRLPASHSVAEKRLFFADAKTENGGRAPSGWKRLEEGTKGVRSHEWGVMRGPFVERSVKKNRLGSSERVAVAHV